MKERDPRLHPMVGDQTRSPSGERYEIIYSDREKVITWDGFDKCGMLLSEWRKWSKNDTIIRIQDPAGLIMINT